MIIDIIVLVAVVLWTAIVVSHIDKGTKERNTEVKELKRIQTNLSERFLELAKSVLTDINYAKEYYEKLADDITSDMKLIQQRHNTLVSTMEKYMEDKK